MHGAVLNAMIRRNLIVQEMITAVWRNTGKGCRAVPDLHDRIEATSQTPARPSVPEISPRAIRQPKQVCSVPKGRHSGKDVLYVEIVFCRWFGALPVVCGDDVYGADTEAMSAPRGLPAHRRAVAGAESGNGEGSTPTNSANREPATVGSTGSTQPDATNPVRSQPSGGSKNLATGTTAAHGIVMRRRGTWLAAIRYRMTHDLSFHTRYP